MIHLYIGRGKGKTTAAVGLALRGCGAGRKICLIRFLKPRRSSEIPMLKKLNVKVVTYNQRHPLFYKSASIAALKKKISKDLRKTEAILKDRRYNFIILDEILYLVQEKLIGEKDILRIVCAAPSQTELVLTGGSASRKLIAIADYVSTIKATKHPFRKGLAPRKGIEY